MEQDHPGSAPEAEFYARCPHCEAVFRIGNQKLQLRQGKVRCGACREVFNAIDNQVARNQLGLFEQLDGARPTRSEGVPTDTPAPRPSVREIIDRNLAAAGVQNPDAQTNGDSKFEISANEALIDEEPESLITVHDEAEFDEEPDSEPDPELEAAARAGKDHWFRAEPDPALDNNPFAARQLPAGTVPATATAEKPGPNQINMQGVDEYIMDRPNPLVGFFWFLVAAGFVVLLGVQVKYYFVDRFAQDERYRPYLSVFCKIAACELQPRRDPYRFTITNTRIDLHPTEPGALRITVKLLNQADFSQPYPELQLTLTDRVGRVVGRRRFVPEFFLEAGRVNRLDSGELGSVEFDLAHPHEKAVGFVVDIVRVPA